MRGGASNKIMRDGPSQIWMNMMGTPGTCSNARRGEQQDHEGWFISDMDEHDGYARHLQQCSMREGQVMKQQRNGQKWTHAPVAYSVRQFGMPHPSS